MEHKSQKDKARLYLTTDEQYTIEKLLDRVPNEFELNMFAAMWSEHISYKSSIRWIEDLPAKGDAIKVPARKENAGVIDFDDNLACVVKLESHNHPTAVNPNEAAVGVGNVIRDLVAMGARPVAQLNVLRFGALQEEQVSKTVQSVIHALGNYSNNYGIPVVGGEILFDKSYTYNPLLNLLAIGVVKKDRIITSSLKNKGDRLVLIGRKTSGTGVHGAGFASSAFVLDEKRDAPDSQLADPHAGKILSDCLLELNDDHVINSMQDIGAGGVLCAASEMAFRGNKGVKIYIESIPVQYEDLNPIDILLSQSQEQMLISVSNEKIDRLEEITAKWGIAFALIGTATEDGYMKVFHKDQILASLPVSSLVRGGGAPVYIRNLRDPERKKTRILADAVPFPANLKELAKMMIRHPNVASRRSIYEQFDTMAGLSNVGPGYAADAGVVHIPGVDTLLALSVDGNSRYVRRDPRIGTMIAVAEAARNIVCSGGVPKAIADGLNFGDPADLHVYYDFTESVKAIKIMSERMSIPVVAGNVSFNNLAKSDTGFVSVQPTPIIGMVGVIEDIQNTMSISFRDKGDMIYILGRSSNDISASEYLAAYHQIEETAPPEFDIEYELTLQSIVSELISKRLINSAHDVSLGGLFVALVECCLPYNLGFDITSPAEVRADAFLFGESQSRIIVSVNPDRETEFLDLMIEKEFPFSALGHVTKQELRIDDNSFGFITDYARDFENALGDLLEN